MSSPLPVIVLTELSLHFINSILQKELHDLPDCLVLTCKQSRSRDLFQAFANESSDEDFIGSIWLEKGWTQNFFKKLQSHTGGQCCAYDGMRFSNKLFASILI
jgi:hypothetical protein